MVRRRLLKLLLVLALVPAAWILYLSSGVELGILSGPQSIASNDIQLRRTLQVVEDHQTDVDKNCSGGTSMYDGFCVISPYENEVRNTSKAGSVTLCTQATVDFLEHVVVLCGRWAAPISVAVYCPHEDYKEARILVHLMRQCDFCVRHWVNWHFFFPLQTEVPSVFQFEAMPNCSSISQKKLARKWRSQGTYPINVGRNVARRLATTRFVFSNDIELYPSLGIPGKFERMLQSQNPGDDNQVWVLPVFEVKSEVQAPLLKSQLRTLFATKKAISFHMYRCNICHKIPNLTQWISHEENVMVSEVEESLEPLKVWSTVKRSIPYNLHVWEPFFIGTNNDPEFDTRLSWEGKQNKMQMAYEMCLRDYDFHINEDAFLVHSPGINRYNATKEKERNKHLAHNDKVIQMAMKNLKLKYGPKIDCG